MKTMSLIISGVLVLSLYLTVVSVEGGLGNSISAKVSEGIHQNLALEQENIVPEIIVGSIDDSIAGGTPAQAAQSQESDSQSPNSDNSLVIPDIIDKTLGIGESVAYDTSEITFNQVIITTNKLTQSLNSLESFDFNGFTINNTQFDVTDNSYYDEFVVEGGESISLDNYEITVNGISTNYDDYINCEVSINESKITINSSDYCSLQSMQEIILGTNSNDDINFTSNNEVITLISINNLPGGIKEASFDIQGNIITVSGKVGEQDNLIYNDLNCLVEIDSGSQVKVFGNLSSCPMDVNEVVLDPSSSEDKDRYFNVNGLEGYLVSVLGVIQPIELPIIPLPPINPFFQLIINNAEIPVYYNINFLIDGNDYALKKVVSEATLEIGSYFNELDLTINDQNIIVTDNYVDGDLYIELDSSTMIIDYSPDITYDIVFNVNSEEFNLNIGESYVVSDLTVTLNSIDNNILEMDVSLPNSLEAELQIGSETILLEENEAGTLSNVRITLDSINLQEESIIIDATKA